MNGHGRGGLLLALDMQLRLHDTLRDFARTFEIANEEVSEVAELRWHNRVLGRVTHRVLGAVTQRRKSSCSLFDLSRAI